MDKELLELCKEVYKRFPEWNDTDARFGNGDMSWIKRRGVDMKATDIPLYTSDYILDKLLPITTVELIGLPSGEVTLLYRPEKPDYTDYTSATSLKALLKLVITLDDANQLPKSPKEDPLQGGK